MSNSRLKVRSWGTATCPQRVRCIVHGLPIIHSDLWHEQKAASFFLFAGPFDVRKFMAALCQFLQVASPARSFLFVRAGLSIVPLTNGRPPPPTPTARRSQFRIAFGACPYRRRILARNLGCQKGPVFLPPRVSVAVKATVEAFSRAYEKATPDKQAALRVRCAISFCRARFAVVISTRFDEARKRASRHETDASLNFCTVLDGADTYARSLSDTNRELAGVRKPLRVRDLWKELGFTRSSTHTVWPSEVSAS
jgi:hypothetical protein